MGIRRGLLPALLLMGGCAIPVQYHSSGLMAPLPHNGPAYPLCHLEVSLADPELASDPIRPALEAQMQSQITHFIQGDGRFALAPEPDHCQGTQLALTFTDITDLGQFEVYTGGMPMTLTAVAEVRYWQSDRSAEPAQQFRRSSVMTLTPELNGDMAGTNLLYLNSVRNKTRLIESILAELHTRMEAQ